MPKVLLLILFTTVFLSLNAIESRSNTNRSLALDIIFMGSKLRVELCTGTPPQCLNVGLSLMHFFTWIADKSNPLPYIHKYERTKSSTYEKQVNGAVILSLDNQVIKGDHFADSIWLNKTEVPKINLFAGIQSFENYDGVLSLGNIPSHIDTRYSILDQMKEKKMIPKKMFAIHIMNETRGRITFGYLPPEIEADMPNYKIFSSDIRQPGYRGEARWGIKLKQIKLTHQREVYPFEANAPINFDYNRLYTNVPLDLFTRLKETIFKDLIDKKKCALGNKNGYQMFICNSSFDSDDEKFKLLHFTFDTWEMVIPKDKLFLFDYKNDEYEFVLANREEDKNMFFFGTSILKLFHMVYNSDDKQIGFYPSHKYLELLDSVLPQNNNFNTHSYQKEESLKLGEEDQLSLWSQLMIYAGMALVITGSVIVIWLGFRYYRRKSNDYTNASNDYIKIKK